MNFQTKLDNAISKNNSLLCIALDPESEHLFDFNKKIIDATHNLVCAYKPNSAFYEAFGATGLEQLKQTVDYIRQVSPELPIILDSKRADIGNTNHGYVTFAFDYLGVDAITVNPYMGGEALQPFFEKSEKGIIVMCRTSNPGAGEFQDLLSDNKPLYQHVAEKASGVWNKNGNVMLVVGATYPDELQKVREIVGDMTLLVPGIGAQGGDLGKTLTAGLTADKKGLIIVVGRSIINAVNPAEEAKKIKEEINKYR